LESKNRGYLFLLSTILLFSTYEVVSKTLVGKIDPFQINFIRFLIGGVLLSAVLFFKGDFKIKFKDFLWVLAAGVINVVISMNLMQLSLYMDGAKASLSAVIFSSNPIFVSIFAMVWDKEKLSSGKIAGLLLGVAGIIVIFLNKLRFDNMNMLSPLFALFSAITYGLYTVIGRKLSVKIGSLKMNSYSFIMGSLVLLPILIIKGSPVITFDYSGIGQVLYLAVFVTGIAYLTYFKGLSILGAGKGSMVFFIKPVLASVLAIIFLKEGMSVFLVAGTALILSGIVLVLNTENKNA